ncbi:MAG: hypothetical protein ACREC0_13335, partial [Methylocella sp.]
MPRCRTTLKPVTSFVVETIIGKAQLDIHATHERSTDQAFVKRWGQVENRARNCSPRSVAT